MLTDRLGVTIARNARGSELLREAFAIAEALNASYVARPHNMTLDELQAAYELTAVIVLGSSGLKLRSGNFSFSYHPGMAVLRLKKLKEGGSDHFLDAMGIKAGSRVLDATMGLAQDAAVASYVVGIEGEVIGVEASPLLYFLVNYGLKHYVAEDVELTEALRRIETVNLRAETYLAGLAANSFDVVYFDPMFRKPVKGSVAMDAMRPLALKEPLNLKVVHDALRVAPRVVVKERSRKLLEDLGCQEFTGGRYSRVQYGIIRR